nr:hypothetical protein [Tanacetum cinerariifolium]
MEECHKLLTDNVDDPILRHSVSKPLPLGGPPGQVTIQSDFFFDKDLEYLRYDSKGRRPALSISKIKAAYYPDAGLEQMVPDPFWIEEECKYDIAAMYGISHWWFQRQRFYIDRHTSEGDRSAVRTHMRILSVEYLAKVAKHQRYLAGETGSYPDSPALKPTKTARKPKPTAPKADPRPLVSKLVSTKQLEPKSTPAKTQGNKRKLTTEISNKPFKAMKSRPGLVSKKCKPLSSVRSVDESVAEDVHANEPQVDDEEADMQRALEEILKRTYDVPRGSLPPVVIREPESGKYQPLPEVPGKGKEKVTEEQVSHDLLNLQTPKKKSHVDQYIFQRRTSTPTGSSGDDESLSLYAKLGLIDSEEESEEAGSNPDEQDEGQARPDPGNAEESHPMPSPVVHAGSDREHMDLDVADVSPQPLPEQMDEGFTATAYPKVQENLKLTVAEQVLLEEPASSSGTLSSLQHLTKDLRFGDLFFSDKPSKADNDKATAKTKAESMVSVTIQQDMSLIPPMTTPTIDLTSRPESPKLYEALEKSMNRDHSEELVKDLAEVRKKKKKSRESPKTPHGSPPHQPPPPPPPVGSSRASGSPGASGSSQVLPPPPPPSSTNQEGQSKDSATPSSSKTVASAEYQAWMMTDIRLRPSISLTPADLQIDDDMAPDEQAQSSDDEDIRNSHILKVNLRQDWWKPLEEKRPATPEPAWSIPSSDVPHNVSKPLPLGGQPGQVTIQSDFFFNKDLEYLRYGSKGNRPALSISKMKAAYYPDVGLEQMVPDQIWIEEECKYDIAAMYGISHWWFQRQRFYIDRHTSEGDRRAVRTHMRILSVVRIKVFSMYGYDYMKKIVLRRDDLNEHVIAERDFKYLYPSDFEDLYLLNLQGHLNHLPPKDKKTLTTALNLTKPRWDATSFEYKHDYTIIDSPRAITFQDRYGVKMIMRFNEIHKFSDGTLQQIDEVDSVKLISPDDEASELGFGANTFMKGVLSTGAIGFSSMKVDSAATP